MFYGFPKMPEQPSTEADPAKDEVAEKQAKIISFVDQLREYLAWVKAEEIRVSEIIGGKECQYLETLKPPTVTTPVGKAYVWVDFFTEGTLGGKAGMDGLVKQNEKTALYRYLELIVRGKTQLNHSLTFADEEIELWRLCPLSEFRRVAAKYAKRAEDERVREARRRNVPISEIPKEKEDYFDEVIPSRLEKHSQVLKMVTDAIILSLMLSEKVWKELSKQIANSPDEPLNQKRINKYYNDITSLRQERADRGVTGKTMLELHTAMMKVLVEDYQAKRRGLQVLVVELHELHTCWFPDSDSDSDAESQAEQEDDVGTGSGSDQWDGNGKGKGRAHH